MRRMLNAPERAAPVMGLYATSFLGSATITAGNDVYVYGYGAAAGEDVRPSRVTLAYPGFDVRIVVDAWR